MGGGKRNKKRSSHLRSQGRKEKTLRNRLHLLIYLSVSTERGRKKEEQQQQRRGTVAGQRLYTLSILHTGGGNLLTPRRRRVPVLGRISSFLS